MSSRFAVGTDIVEVDRIKALSDKHGQRFFKHVFTQQEVDWCNQRRLPQVHLAGRFAAKEAIKKALMASGEERVIPMNSIEILRDENQPPEVVIHCDLSHSYRIQISISHTDTLATAVAIAEIL